MNQNALNPLLDAVKIGDELALVSVDEKTGERTPFRVVRAKRITPNMIWTDETRDVRLSRWESKQVPCKFRKRYGNEFNPSWGSGRSLSAIPAEIELARTFEARREQEEGSLRAATAAFDAQVDVQSFRTIRNLAFNRDDREAILILRNELAPAELKALAEIAAKLKPFINR